jgi:hypothetical protein
MKFKFLLLIIFSLLLLNIISAEESGGVLTGKQNDCIQLPQECADCTYVTLTSIQYPNMSRSYINTAMTKQGSSFNYSFCNTNDLGQYVYCVIGDVGGTDTVACKDFEVTSTGESFDISQSVMLFAQFGIIIMFLVISFAFDKTKWKIRNLFHMFAIFTGIILLNSIRVIAGTSASLSSMADIGLVSGIIILIFMFLFTLINYTIEVFLYFKQRRKMRWEIKEQI